MTEEKYDGPVIRFSLSSATLGAHVAWIRVPEYWDDMSKGDREEFLVEEAQRWASNYIELGTVYSSPDEAREATRDDRDRAYSGNLEPWFY